MKGAVKILFIITVLVFGMVIILHSSIGTTPVYYHALPETQFSELLSSYTHAETNIDRTISEDSDRIFTNIQNYPIEWDYSWTSHHNFLNELGEKLGSSSEKYFDSVYITEGDVEMNISKIDSAVDYSSADQKLMWDYTYRIHMRSKLFSSKIANEIDTVKDVSVEFDFLDLDEAYDCASDFFNALNTKPYSFDRESSFDVQNKLREQLTEHIGEKCSGFDTSINLSVWCGAHDCDFKKIKPIPVILTISETGKGSISFSKEFTNFQHSENIQRCVSGSECGNKDCISSSCGTCWSGNYGAPCSPSGSSSQLGMSRCQMISEKEFKCLPDPDIKIFVDGIPKKKKWEIIELNCGEKHKKLSVDGMSDYFYDFNEVKIEGGEIDLCDLPRTNGRLTIFAKSGEDEYALGGMGISFKLSQYINNINADKFVYKFDTELCSEFKETVENWIKSKMSSVNIKGYEWDVKLLDIACSGEEANWWGEKYSRFRVDFREGSSVNSIYHIVEYEPK